MKLLFATLALSLSLQAQWSTATSFSFGAKYFDELKTADIKIEEFFINNDQANIYYKFGFYNEQLAHWSIDSTQTTIADQGQNISVGAGYNLMTLGNFFIDTGLSLNYRMGTSDKLTAVIISGSTVNVVSQYNDSPVAIAAEVGAGYAIGSFTIRLDIFAAANGSVTLLNANTQTELQSDVAYSRVHANLGVAYWW